MKKSKSQEIGGWALWLLRDDVCNKKGSHIYEDHGKLQAKKNTKREIRNL